MLRGVFWSGIAVALAAGTALADPLSPILTENFSNDPVTNGRAVVQSDDPTAGSRFVTSGGTLTAAYNTSEQTAKLLFPLGRTLTQNDTFAFAATLKILNDEAYHVNDSGFAAAQIAFGLANSVTTGYDRTSTPTDFSSDDTYDVMTVDYFPNPTFQSIGPTEIDSQSGSSDAFAGLHSTFGSESLLGEPGEVTALPLDTPLTFTLEYDSATQTMTLTLNGPGGPININEDGGFDGTEVGGPDGQVNTIQYTFLSPPNFSVDSFAIPLWTDGFNDPDDNSVVADVQFDQFQVLVAPEPASLMLLGLPVMGLVWGRRRARA